jgi:hypothetical protein
MEAMAGNLATGFERARVISGEHGGAQGVGAKFRALGFG